MQDMVESILGGRSGEGGGGILGGLLGAGGGAAALVPALLAMLGEKGGPGGGGGLGALVAAFESNGLGDVVGSWVGTGQNLPITAQQIQQALGPKVRELAQQHGLGQDAVTTALSQLLPGLVDHLTPDGQLPAGNALEQTLSGLRSKLGF